MVNSLTDKAFRNPSEQDRARDWLRELHRRGLTWQDIAGMLGFSRVFVGRVVRDKDPDPVSLGLWNALVEKGGMSPIAPPEEQTTLQTPPSGQTVPLEQFQEVVTMLKAQMRLTTSALDRLDQHSELLVKLSDRIDLLLARERNQTA